jgi:hypothetical protein
VAAVATDAARTKTPTTTSETALITNGRRLERAVVFSA